MTLIMYKNSMFSGSIDCVELSVVLSVAEPAVLDPSDFTTDPEPTEF